MSTRQQLTGILLIMSMVILFIAGCDESPMDRLTNPLPDGALNSWSGTWTIYDDQMHTGGNISFIPEWNGHQLIELDVTLENPPQGSKCMRYQWDGQDLWWEEYSRYEHTWAGVTFIVATSWKKYDTTPGRDLRDAGYTKITFWAKGNIDDNTTVKFEGSVSSSHGGTDYVRVDNTQLTNTWQQYTIPLTANDLGNVKDYFKIVFEYNGTGYGNGGTVWVDDVKYTR